MSLEFENRYKKTKEAVRTQIQLRAKYYRDVKKVLFFDENTPSLEDDSYNIDDKDVEVLLIQLNYSKKILVTTKCLFVIDKSVTIRIDASDIKSFDFMPSVNHLNNGFLSVGKRMVNRYRLRRHFGDLRIHKKDGTFIDVFMPKHNLLYCLISVIKSLQFISKKYEIL